VKVYNIVQTIVFTAITFIATALLVIETPATGGYFNLGEAAIYVIAFLATPTATAVAAGLGPALADLVLGYWYFAPATFVIKFCEGLIVATLIRKLKTGTRYSMVVRMLTVAMGIILALTILVNSMPSGEEATYASLTWTSTSILGLAVPVPTFVISLPSYTWIAVATLILAISVVMALIRRPYVLAMALGGLTMVLGYFLYEYFISNPLILGRDPVGAIFEVPVNVGQFTAGVLLATPVVQFIERATKG